jgi:membrane protease YdiL (CAAX protease family)
MGILAAVGVMPLAGSRLSIGYIGTLLTLDAILLTGLILVLLRLHGERADTLFLGARPILHEATLGLLLTPAVFLLAVSIMGILRLAVPSLRTVPDNPLAELLSTRQNATIFALVAMIAGGLREELQRAFILHRFEQRLGGATVGIVVFSTAFGLGHLLQGADVAVTTAVLGAFWGLIYLWRRSIVAPVVSHALFNLIQIATHHLAPQITQMDHPQITQITQITITQLIQGWLAQG